MEQLKQIIKEGKIESVRRLLEDGFDPNVKIGINDYALDYAFDYGQYEIAKLLIEHGADINDKANPAMVSAARGKRALFEYLLQKGANINAINHVGHSALSRAIAFKNLSGATALVEMGIDVSEVGGKALRDAAWGGHFGIVKLLVEHGADVNFNGADQVFPYCTTPVQMAASINHFEIVKYLIAHGADVTIRDKYGNRAFLEAKQNKNKEMMEYIKQFEPPIWHEADQRAQALKKMGMPTDIIKWLGTENRRIDLPETSVAAYVEFETIFDVKPIEWQGRIFLDVTKEVEGYGGTGFIIWIPDQKCLGSFDVEHQELFVFEGIKWSKLMKKLPVVVSHVLDGQPIDELYK
ncbi:ankyrin repeat domain-containing protein [Paenibacillus methanolicus]|uniref:Ankyrin repeat protein n=1 Tax=Paenibacillus methanolicus TaxID=582686 RepID=A0A5S5C1W4_9BACL|nr:ankyrin repeat domain-containing protein [Paenibacillus methanolicus]TYP73294.1 ankyrin repeat protein [Paenibacillus methanolicus]